MSRLLRHMKGIGALPPDPIGDDPVRLGRELGRGGEGAVREVEGRPDLVAKIYHAPPDAEKAAKLEAMAARANPGLLTLTAWPRALIRENGRVTGFLMPRAAAHRDIHDLYSPKSRKQHFAKADCRFLLRAAANAARAVAAIHAAGCVIGDVNPGGFKLARNATVRLIDCDSFQVADGDEIYTCHVGVPEFTAPELQDRPLRGLVRSENHDAFGLAVLIFHLLFMGRHPFAGRWLGPGEMPLSQAIGEFRYAYGRAQRLMEPPRFTPAPDIFSPEVAALFERAFAPEGAIAGRPDAAEWAETLAAVEARMVQCRANKYHQHLDGLDECPWCRVEGEAGLQLFETGLRNPMQDLVELWGFVSKARPPAPPPLLDRYALSHLRPSVAATRSQWRETALVVLLCALVFLAAVLIIGALWGAFSTIGKLPLGIITAVYAARLGQWLDRPPSDARERSRLELYAAQAALTDVTDRFRRATDPAPFNRRRAELQRLHHRLSQPFRDLAERDRLRRELADGAAALRAAIARMESDGAALAPAVDAAFTRMVQAELDFLSLR